jgi:hypothetical protein
MDSGSRKPLNRRGLIELIVAVALVIAAPILVATQSGQAGEPWNDLWLGDWPALMETGPDPRSAALHKRAAASLERVINGGGDVKLAGDL